MKKIYLSNRYGYRNVLVNTHANEWELNFDKNSPNSLRVIYNDASMKDIYAVDPDGGPMISIGTKFENDGKEIEVKGFSFNNGSWILNIE